METTGRPRALAWAIGLLIGSAIPWTLVFVDNAIVALRDPYYSGSQGGLLVLNVVYICLVLAIPGGRRGVLWTVTIGTGVFCVVIVTSGAAVFATGGPVLVGVIMLLSLAVAVAGLVMLWNPAAREYLEERRAGSVR